MPQASRRVLKELFENGLHFAPNVDDLREFEKLLRVVSPSLIRAALAEIRDTKQTANKGALEWREALFKIYNRKVAEHAQLFPVFHSYETAFRSTVAVLLEEHYNTPRWWEPSKKALVAGNPAVSVTQVGGIRISPNIAKAFYYLVDAMVAQKVNFANIASGYELLEQSDLYHVGVLIEHHWPTFKHLFVRDGVSLTHQHFATKFGKMRDARNAVYHHNSFSGLTYTYETAEDLLAYLGFPLPRVHSQIENSVCAKPPYKGLRP